MSSGRYQLKLEAERRAVSGITNPVTTNISIGNDSGSTTVRTRVE